MISRDVAEDQTSNFTNALSTQVESALPTDVPASQTQGVVSGVLPAFSRGECPKVLTLKACEYLRDPLGILPPATIGRSHKENPVGAVEAG